MRYLVSWMLLCLAVQAQAATYPSLWESASPDMQQKLDVLLGNMGLDDEVERQHLGLAIVDITDPAHPRLAAVNPDKMFYAASLPKIGILLGAFVQIERGKLELDDALWQDMNDMIRSSSNAAATRVLQRVGRKELIAILSSPRFRLYDQHHNGGIWVGKDYAGAAAYQRDPLHNLSHGASVIQAARFYFLLETDRLVRPDLTKKMKEILSRPAIEHKFVKGLKEVPEARLYRKSGTWRNYHADSALVELGDRKFIIVGLAEATNGGKWLVDLAKPLIKVAME